MNIRQRSDNELIKQTHTDITEAQIKKKAKKKFMAGDMLNLPN